MIRGLIGRKIGMTQIFDKEGNVMPVSVVQAGPCPVLELKDSPLKVKLGFEEVKESRTTKARLGFFKKIKTAPVRFISEFESSDNKDYKIGQVLKVDVFKAGDFINVTGTSIGKGFQGGMKRWGWAGGGATHGSMHHRRIGAVSSGTDPSRVFKGHHMPGHMGDRRITTEGLRVMGVDIDKNLILVKGSIPGHKNSIVYINRSHKKAFKSLDEQKAVVVHKRNPMKQSKAKTAGKGA